MVQPTISQLQHTIEAFEAQLRAGLPLRRSLWSARDTLGGVPGQLIPQTLAEIQSVAKNRRHVIVAMIIQLIGTPAPSCCHKDTVTNPRPLMRQFGFLLPETILPPATWDFFSADDRNLCGNHFAMSEFISFTSPYLQG